MLKGLIKYRPKNVCAVYVEARGIEVLRASRKWRTWEMDAAEKYNVAPGDSVFDQLQHLGLRPKVKGSALLLFLSGSFYSVHREHYPTSLKDQIEEAVNFDWQENIFHEEDSTLHFFGPAVQIDHQISVPIFAMQREIYEKFHQALNAQQFDTFAVLPSALAYDAFLPSPVPGEPGGGQMQILGRVLDDSHLEVHRFYQGAFLDSMLIGKSQDSLRLFCENLRSMANGDGLGSSESSPHVDLLCAGAECGGGRENYAVEWSEKGLPVRLRDIDGAFITNWVKKIIQQDHVHTFSAEILLKPWEVPRVAWGLLGLVFLFALYAGYQVNASGGLARENKALKAQVSRLETQWKPMEQLQTRISKFQEDKKTLSEFNREGYPLLELLTYLTMITPEDTWLNYVSLRKGQVIIRGESKSAIKYLSELSKTEGLTDVKFASPVTRNPTSDMERFNVQLQLDMPKLEKSLEALPPEKLNATKAQFTGSGAPGVATSPDQVTRGPEDANSAEYEISPEVVQTPPEEAAQ